MGGTRDRGVTMQTLYRRLQEGAEHGLEAAPLPPGADRTHQRRRAVITEARVRSFLDGKGCARSAHVSA